MSALNKFEEFVERLVEKPFSIFQRGHIQPVEIAKRLARAMEAEQTLGVDKIFVPNDYRVLLSQYDFDYFADMRPSMERELSDYLLGIARERHFTLVNRPLVVLDLAEDLKPRQIHILAKFSDSTPTPPPVEGPEEQTPQHTYKIDSRQIAQAAKEISAQASLVLLNGTNAGASLPLNKSIITIGRALDNDIVLEDPSVSRYHAEIKIKSGHYCIRDLHSSNGTLVNSQYVTETILEDGDSVTTGDTELVFEVKRARSS